MERKDPPPLPPLVHVAISMHLKLLGLKALQARLKDCSSWLVKPTLSLSPAILSTALARRPSVAGATTATKPLVYESAHPYDHNKDEYIEVSVKGASKLILTFDPQCATESGCDYVKIYKDNSRSEVWGETTYTGGKDGGESNWPCLKGRPPLVVPASSFVLYFHSDGSVNAWGWRITVQGQTSKGSDGGGSSYGDGARCLLQMLGEGPAKKPMPEGLEAFKAEARKNQKSNAEEMMTALLSKETPSSDIETLPSKYPMAAEGAKKACWPRNFVLNAQDCTEAPIYEEMNAQSALIITAPAGSTLVATEQVGDWLNVSYENADKTYSGWVLRRLGDALVSIFMSISRQSDMSDLIYDGSF